MVNTAARAPRGLVCEPAHFPNMHPAFFAIWLAALHQSMPVNCFPVHLDPSQPRKTMKVTGKRSASVDLGDYLLKVDLNGHVNKAISINSLGKFSFL